MTSVTDVIVIGAGQSGLAATRALQGHGISPLVLEARDRAAGSWPSYYDCSSNIAGPCSRTLPPHQQMTRRQQHA
jgi:putative flavoprotein involved in K+ transport